MILEDILNLIGLIIVIIAIIIDYSISLLLIKPYKRNKTRPTLIFILHFIFAATSMIFLIAEQGFLMYFNGAYEYWHIAKLTADLAYIVSAGAAITIAVFTFYMTFTKYKKVLTSIILGLSCIYVGVLLIAYIPNYSGNIGEYSFFEYSFIETISGYEPKYSYITNLITMYTMIPIIIIGPILFYYYSAKIWKSDSAKGKRSLFMAIALTIVIISYAFELIELQISIFIRIGYIIYAILMYICFKMPEWFKKFIKWKSED